MSTSWTRSEDPDEESEHGMPSTVSENAIMIFLVIFMLTFGILAAILMR